VTAAIEPGGVGAEDVRRVVSHLGAQGVHSVLAQFVDIHGVAKGKLVPLKYLDEWVRTGAGFAGPSIWGTGLPRFGPRSEYYGRVQLHTLQPLPFMPGVARAVCDGYAGGEPLDTCSRGVLKRQLALLARRGWRLMVGVEPEFFLLRRDGQGGWAVGDGADRLDKPSYDLKSIHRNQALLDDLRGTLLALDFDLLQIDHEDAIGQYEVNYRFDEALAAADRFILFKLAAHAVAERHGLTFSGMPKPLAHAPGSGLHFHLSIVDAQGQPVLASRPGAMGLSETGQRFVAGLLHHADAVCALCAPTVNSYKRLAVSQSASGTTWSPVWKAAGENNRTCVVRTVDGRVEWRLPDPSCNIYAALAAVVAAGMAGIDGQFEPAMACDEDLYEKHARGEAMPGRLPRDLWAALEALDADRVLRSAIGKAFCAQFLDLKRAEWTAYSQSVSAWEMGRYADLA
jgi:glutamine synthetase